LKGTFFAARWVVFCVVVFFAALAFAAVVFFLGGHFI